MRNARSGKSADFFLGVRLTTEEASELERLREARGFSSRSDAVRSLVRGAAELTPAGTELPVGLEAELDQLVADGWASDRGSALQLAVTFGLGEIARLHAERLVALQRSARDAADRRASRRGADREGRGLLRR